MGQYLNYLTRNLPKSNVDPSRNHLHRTSRAAFHAAHHRLRGEVLRERVPTAGLLILRDGEPGEPKVTPPPLRLVRA
jgi:hypothetical protein